MSPLLNLLKFKPYYVVFPNIAILYLVIKGENDFAGLPVKNRREIDTIPVRLCERSEKKEKKNIKNVVLESLESKFFTMKYSE